MDKLQWFKFSPSEFIMGSISRLPINTQGHFIRVCCIYWNKDCIMDLKELERLIPKNALKGLLDYEIITLKENKISIGFLDEQMAEIDKVREANSRAGKRSAEARKQRKLNESLTTVQRNLTEKDKEIDIDNNSIYRSFNHLSITYGELRKLLEVYTIESINHILDSIENYKNNKQYKSLYLTAKNWLKADDVKQAQPEKTPIFDTYANNIINKIKGND